MAISSAAKPAKTVPLGQKTVEPSAPRIEWELPVKQAGDIPKDSESWLREKVAGLEATVKLQDAAIRQLSSDKDAAKILDVLNRIADKPEERKELKAITPLRNAEGFVERYEFEWQE